ncbi:Uncharacterised protein [uncultured archaeon]|nr:Uncharacterised protein [uncultured archaeon]
MKPSKKPAPKSSIINVPLEVPKVYADTWRDLRGSNKIKALNPKLSEDLINFIVQDVINDLRYETTRCDFEEAIRELRSFGELTELEAEEAIREINQAPDVR